MLDLSLRDGIGGAIYLHGATCMKKKKSTSRRGRKQIDCWNEDFILNASMNVEYILDVEICFFWEEAEQKVNFLRD